MNIVKIRRKSGLNQTDFGKSLGVSKQAISTYENGRDVPPTTQKLINILYERKK